MAGLPSMNRFDRPKTSSSALFHETIEFPSLEKLCVKNVADQDEVKGLWNSHVLTEKEGDAPIITSNPMPMLKKVEFGEREALWSIPSMIYNNLSSFMLDGNYETKMEVSSSVGRFSKKEEFRWKSSDFPNLENLHIRCFESVVELFEKKDFSVDYLAATFFKRLKVLQLEDLPRLNLIPLHLLKGLCSLHLHSLNWKYLISADALRRVQGLLQQLEELIIKSCKNLKVIIEDDVESDVALVFEFPRLKILRILDAISLIEFSSNLKDKLLLPALESLDICRFPECQQFWSGLIIAPTLKDVAVWDCPKLRSVSSGPLIASKLQEINVRDCSSMQRFSFANLNEDDVIELPDLKKVCIERCDHMQSFSWKPVIAPNLTKVELKRCSSMKWFLSEKTDHNNVVQKFPFLESVEINNCPNMQSMCNGILQAPNLTHAMFNQKKYSMLEIGDLNKFLRSRSGYS